MSLIKHRPALSLRAPPEIHPGGPFVVTLEVDAKEEVPIEFAELTLEGSERASVPAGKSRSTYRQTHVSLRAILAERGVIPAGRHELRARFELPGFAPPSYTGPWAAAEYVVSARVSIPWWPDRTGAWVLFVRRPPVELVRPTPLYYSTDPSGPKAREPHVECSVADELVVPGGVVAGSVALGNVAHNDYRAVHLYLVGSEECYDDRGRLRCTSEIARYGITLPVQGAEEGTPLGFRMRVPGDLPLSFRSRLWRVRWALEVTADIGWARDVTMAVPLTVVSRGSRRAGESRLAVPTIGSERVRALWDAVALDHGLAVDGDAMRGRIGEVDVTITRAHRGGDGIFLVGELRYPSLHLGLDGGLASGFRRIVGGGVSFGDAAWDRAHYVAGREPDQVRSFVVVLFGMLRRHRVADFDDEHLAVELRDAGTSEKTLRGFCASLVAIARAIPAARDAIPPPARMVHAVPAWQRLARTLDGPLELARMAVRGHVDGAPCEVFTDWSSEAEPLRTVLRVDAGVAVDADRRLRWSVGGVAEGDPSRLPPDAAALWSALQRDAQALVIGERIVEALLAGAIDAPDPDVLDPLRRMARLAGLLRGHTGPYR